MRWASRFVAFSSLAIGSSACSSQSSGDTPLRTFPYPLEDALHVNHIQLKATHNSYHIAAPDSAPEAAYSHPSLAVQLADLGVRGVELDLHLSGDGSFDVFHTFVDARTNCKKLVDCLRVLYEFSNAHPAHHPIFIHVEPKDLTYAESAGDYVARLESEVLSVLPRSRIVTPDDVKGTSASLVEAILARGWPTLRSTRAKFVFYVDDRGFFHDAYTRKGTSLEGRLMFIDGKLGDPYAVFLIRNDPTADAEDIGKAVRAGLIVRTRTDADTVEARANNTRRRDAALASGAQILSTDYEAKVDGTDYVVDIPDGSPSRCDGSTAPAGCTPEAVEDPAFMSSTSRGN